MGALSLEDRKDPSTVAYYAPQQRHRADGEQTIRPVLERLKRNECAENLAFVASGPTAVDIQNPIVPPFRQHVLLAGRFVIVTGLLAVSGVLAVSLRETPTGYHAQAATAESPKRVHTITYRPKQVEARLSDRFVETQSAAPGQAAPREAAPDRDAVTAARPPAWQSDTDLPLAAPLKLWGMVPTALTAVAANAPLAQATAQAEHKWHHAQPHLSKSKHGKQKHRRHRHPSTRVKTDATANAKNPIRTALHALFGPKD